MWLRPSASRLALISKVKIGTALRRSPKFTPRLDHALEDRALMSTGLHALNNHHPRQPIALFQVQNLVSDGSTTATTTDVKLKNPWGLAASPKGPWWISNNGTGSSTLYNGNTAAKLGLQVAIPSPTAATGGTPTGVVFNGNSNAFPINGAGTSAFFVFASEDGTITAWNAGTATSAVVKVNNSASGAVYKGLAIDTNGGNTYIYATNFHSGKVEVYDSNFATKTFSSSQFTDPRVPAGYAPFGIQNVNGTIYVTYAKQDSDKHDNVSGRGLGIVDAYSSDGTLVGRVGARGPLNAPWGIAAAPSTFGRFAGDLLVGNFGDGRINAFKMGNNGRFRFDGILRDPQTRPITIDGLWGLAVGNNNAAGSADTLFFTAGTNDEKNGLFGSITKKS